MDRRVSLDNRLRESRCDVEEVEKNIREAIGLCLEVRAELWMPLTVETRVLEVVA
jgi:hypothetical protein